MGKEMRSKRVKATSFCLMPWLSEQRDYEPPGVSPWTEHPGYPETWQHAALKQVFGSTFLFRLSWDRR